MKHTDGDCSQGYLIEKIGRSLFEAMQHLAPTDDRDWIRLSRREKEFYCCAIQTVLEFRESEVSAFLAGDDMVGRSIKVGENPDSYEDIS